MSGFDKRGERVKPQTEPRRWKAVASGDGRVVKGGSSLWFTGRPRGTVVNLK